MIRLPKLRLQATGRNLILARVSFVVRYEDTGEFATASCDISQGRQPRAIFTSGHDDPHIAIPLLAELGVDVVGSFFGEGSADRYQDLARGLLPEDIPERLLLASLCPLTSKLTCSHGELSLMTWANDKSARIQLVAELFAKLTIPARRAQLQAMVVDIASMLDACQRCELFLRHANRTGLISVLLKHVHDSRACKNGLTIPAATIRARASGEDRLVEIHTVLLMPSLHKRHDMPILVVAQR